VRFLKTTDAKEKFFASGAEVVGSSPEEAGAAVKAEIAQWAKVIKEAGIRAD
jgi:tripartite-type tricarboxylate transporter receptor subunit TctC